MSRSIYIKVKLNKKFYEVDTSEFLFRIIQEGCSRRIAIAVAEFDGETCNSDECILNLSDSFNYQFVTPLIGRDIDSEVIEYRPEPLYSRLLNLQELFSFIFEQDVVKKIEVLLTLDYDIEGIESINITIDNFAHHVKKMMSDKSCLNFCCKFVWRK